jgi:hypothetical protein
MPSSRTPTGRISWPLLAAVLAAQFAALCLAWALTHSSWPQGALLLASFIPLRALSVRGADTDPFPVRAASETRQRDLLLVAGFLALLFGLSMVFTETLKTTDIYPGPYAVAYLAAWVPLSFAWNLLGYQRYHGPSGDIPER